METIFSELESPSVITEKQSLTEAYITYTYEDLTTTFFTVNGTNDFEAWCTEGVLFELLDESLDPLDQPGIYLEGV